VTVGTAPFAEMDDVIECVRGRVVFVPSPVPESGGWLPEPVLVGNSRVLTLDTVRFLALCSEGRTEPTARDSSLAWPSGPWLLTVAREADDNFRVLFRARATSKSSDKLPYDVNCDCSDGWVRAEAKASRAGNGVKFRT
jgi:hypothetical protein